MRYPVITFLFLLLLSCRSIPERFVINETTPLSPKALVGIDFPSRVGETARLDLSRYSEDNTTYIQSVLDSEAAVVVIPAEPGPWYTEALFINRDNLTIVFEKGARIEAKIGGFEDNGACLLTVKGHKNIQLIGRGGSEGFYMQKKDYQSSAYMKGEWRHGLSLISAEKILIEGLTIASSGGDGVYVGQAKSENYPTYCQDITIRNCRILDHHRQGVSVISVDGFLMENTLCWGTRGTLPKAGIDFEPNRAEERLVNCRVVNCHFEDNAGPGIYIFLRKFDETTMAVDIAIEDCVSRGNLLGFSLTRLNHNPGGTVTLINNDFGLNLLGRMPKKSSVELIRKD